MGTGGLVSNLQYFLTLPPNTIGGGAGAASGAASPPGEGRVLPCTLEKGYRSPGEPLKGSLVARAGAQDVRTKRKKNFAPL